MQPLNAIDAIAPAFTRTHQTLFEPFRAGRSWKLAAAAYVAFIGSVFVPFPLLLLAVPVPFPLGRALLAALLLVPTLLVLAVFYFGVRMQPVHFEMVVTRAKFIAPMWRRYGKRTWPWLGLKVGLGTVISLASMPLLIASGRNLVQGLPALMAQFPQTAPGAQPDPVALQQMMFGAMGHLVSILLPFYATLLAVFLVLKLCSTLVEDFALPFAILDELPLAESLRMGARVVARDPVQVVLYLLMKFALTVLGFIAQTVANQILLIPVFIAGALIGALGGLLTYAITGGHGGAAAVIVGAVLGYGIVIVASLWAQVFTLGYLLTLLEAYAIYFLGGRYQKLGDYLVPPSYTYAPPPLPPAPEQDEDGPDLPMNPALV